MSKATVFVVIGTTGEYSDRSEWLVAAYTKEEDAKQHVVKATEYADAWMANHDSLTYEERLEDKRNNPLDPSFSFSCDYTGTRYSYGEVPLLSKFTAPEVLQ